MNSHIPVSQPPTRRVSDAQRKSSRQLDGFASAHKSPPLQSLTRPELLNLRERTHAMLHNSTIMATLPDKGSKLKEKLALIDTLLNSSNDTPETVTEEVSKLSLENNSRPNIRKKSVADANLEACRINLSSNLLQAHAITHKKNFPDDMETIQDDTISGSKSNDDRQQAKVRMISLDESVRLQNTQRDRIKEEGFKKQLQLLKSNSSAHHGDDISATMSRMQLGDGGQSDEEGGDNDDGDDDDDDDDDDDSDYNYDSAYDEDEGSVPGDGLEQDDYYDGQYQQR